MTLVAAFGVLWALRYKPASSTTVLLVVVLFVCPLLGLVGQIIEYRRVSGLLELLYVLKRGASKRISESHEDAGE